MMLAGSTPRASMVSISPALAQSKPEHSGTSVRSSSGSVLHLIA
jgi:hypothetical protein